MKTNHGIAITSSWINFLWQFDKVAIQLVRFTEGSWFSYSKDVAPDCCGPAISYEVTLFQTTLAIEIDLPSRCNPESK